MTKTAIGYRIPIICEVFISEEYGPETRRLLAQQKIDEITANIPIGNWLDGVPRSKQEILSGTKVIGIDEDKVMGEKMIHYLDYLANLDEEFLRYEFCDRGLEEIGEKADDLCKADMIERLNRWHEDNLIEDINYMVDLEYV